MELFSRNVAALWIILLEFLLKSVAEEGNSIILFNATTCWLLKDKDGLLHIKVL